MSNNEKKSTKVFALGGLEEIGKNTYCIEHNEEIIIIDAGIKFPSKNLLGVNKVIPNYDYLVENKHKIKALFITHGHEDHIGGIPFLLKQVQIPFIYAPRLAAALIKDRLNEYNLKVTVKEVDGNSMIKTKYFYINYFRVNHSIPDAFGIAFHTPNGVIVTTGDYKFDWTPLGHRADLEKLSIIGKSGVKLLLADSTNAEHEGYTITEKGIVNNIREIFLKAKGRILLTTFASNVHRIQEVVNIANELNKKIVILGRSMDRIVKIINKLGHIDIDNNVFIKDKQISKYEDNQILIICTGSQGEENAALSRISRNEHKNIKIKKNDTIIFSSSAIPGNYYEVETVVNNLIKEGANVYENSKEFPIHTSGHASKEEQKILFTILKPKFFMPMHGDYRMLKEHGETATSINVDKKNVFLCSNGDQLEILNDKAWIGKRINAEPVYIDGNDITGKTSSLINDRQTLGKDGAVVITIFIDTKNNQLINRPKIIFKGGYYNNAGSPDRKMASIISEAVKFAFNSKKTTFALIKKSIKERIAPYIYKNKKRSPLIVPIILTLN